MLWTSFRKVINIENALQYFTFRNLGYHFTSKKMHSINFRKCPLFLLTNYEVAWGLDVSSDCNVFLKSFSVINDAFKYLVEGNLSRHFLLATNLSPPTSRMTHLPSHLQMKVTDLIRRMSVNIFQCSSVSLDLTCPRSEKCEAPCRRTWLLPSSWILCLCLSFWSNSDLQLKMASQCHLRNYSTQLI